jgi:hypothetical protein
VLGEWESLVDAALRWQEEAQLGEWAQPAEYVTLEQMAGDYSSLLKKVRMGGG